MILNYWEFWIIGVWIIEVLLYYHEIVYCVYSLESHHRGESYEYTKVSIIL